MKKGLVRSKHNKVISGVCGGIGEYFNVDPTIIRLGFVIATVLSGGAGLFAYIVAFFIMPEADGNNAGNFTDYTQSVFNDDYDPDKDFSSVLGDDEEYMRKDYRGNKAFVGICLIVLGVVFLAKEYLKKYIHIDFKILGPLLLIGIGALIVFKGGRRLP
ncbi:MAG TPA: PspC domain-containing protein [Acetivibrio sp.]|uniref:PspC domain-containing protein n=1 Tax=Acetivibrio sp. TaxID=1872092 RepID=UPI002C791A80|nr:PspC domain-containing protein [Acetivibrio sp.]HOM01797.1 PspC domain-containing protein [Acetivibrio sp.]